MGFANFFDKAALGAAAIIKDFDRHSFENQLEANPVSIVCDDRAVASREGLITVELLVNLCARLFPSICLIPHGAKAAHQCQAFCESAKAINPELTIESGAVDKGTSIVVGSMAHVSTRKVFFVGSDGWVSHISAKHPVMVKDSANPFGAAAAACLAMAKVFEATFLRAVESPSAEDDLRVSVLDYSSSQSTLLNPAWIAPNIGEAHLVGVGAIGSGVIWALSRIPEIVGKLHLIDPEDVELTNLQRYVICDQQSLNRSKVDVGRHCFRSGLQIVTHRERWESYANSHDNYRFERVLTALDSAEARTSVQASLPRTILNGWTQGSVVGLSRHLFDDDNACLTCLYIPDGRKKNEDEVVAAAIGIPEASREIRDLLFSNAPIGPAWIARIAQARQVDPKTLEPFSGCSIRQFYTSAVCGGILLRLSPGRPAVEVPMAFQSALAGILLAAELISDAGRLRDGYPFPITQIDVLANRKLFLSEKRRKDHLGRCICQDPIYQSAYKEKYASAEPTL